MDTRKVVPVLLVAHTRNDATEIVFSPTRDGHTIDGLRPGDWVVALLRVGHVRRSGGYVRLDQDEVRARTEFSTALDETYIVPEVDHEALLEIAHVYEHSSYLHDHTCSRCGIQVPCFEAGEEGEACPEEPFEQTLCGKCYNVVAHQEPSERARELDEIYQRLGEREAERHPPGEINVSDRD